MIGPPLTGESSPLHLGYLVGPPDPISAVRAARFFVDIHPPILEQIALAGFIAEGHFTRHLRRMRALYQAPRDALVAAQRRDMGGNRRSPAVAPRALGDEYRC